MELDALPGGNPERVIAVVRGEIVEDNPLRRGHNAAGDTPTNHHDELLLRLAQIPVVLLVDAVKLDELLVVGGELVRARGHSSRNSAAKRRVRFFDHLIVGDFGFRACCNHKCYTKLSNLKLSGVNLSNSSQSFEQHLWENLLVTTSTAA